MRLTRQLRWRDRTARRRVGNDGRIEADDPPGYPQLCAEPLNDAKQPLGAGRRRERVHEHSLLLRAEPAHATDALLQPGGIPWKVEMHDDGRALQIQALAEHVGGDEKRDPLSDGDLAVIGARRKLGQHVATADMATGDAPAGGGERGNTAAPLHEET